MQVVTTRRPTAPKPFTWSYSRLKNFEACPKRHWHIDVLPKGHPDKVVEPKSEQLEYGDLVHKIMEQYIDKGIVMPPYHEPKLKPAADRALTYKGKDVRELGAKVMVEQKFAITEELKATTYFADDVWFRGIGDLVWILGGAAYIGDWKTGKVQEDSKQLALMAQCIFSHHPEVKVCKSEFVWLKENTETTAVIRREDMPLIWAELLPRVEASKHAYNTTSYPAKPGPFCARWCPVSQCPHNGS